MEVTRYESFKEIDERLRILRLQREIDRESIKLGMNRAKTQLHPAQFMGGLRGTLQKILFTLALRKLSQWLQKARQGKSGEKAISPAQD